MKRCAKCAVLKQDTHFYLTHSTRDKMSKNCKECTSPYVRKYQGVKGWTPERQEDFRKHMSEMNSRPRIKGGRAKSRKEIRKECEEYLKNGKANNETKIGITEQPVCSAEPQSIPDTRQGPRTRSNPFVATCPE